MGRVRTTAQDKTDPLLTSVHWRTVVRPHWRALRLPCARCGGLIDYESGRFVAGTRKVNPRSFIVGHVVGRDEARRMGWTDEQISAISNTQPEHARCSDRSGGQYLRQLQTGRTSGRLRRIDTPRALDNSREW